jgi:hypothetical protein
MTIYGNTILTTKLESRILARSVVQDDNDSFLFNLIKEAKTADARALKAEKKKIPSRYHAQP